MRTSKLLVSLVAALAFACGAGVAEKAAEAKPATPEASGTRLAPPEWLHGFWRVDPGAIQGRVFEAGDYIDVGKGGTFYARGLSEMLRLQVFTGFSQKAAEGRYEISYETPLGRIREIFSLEPGETGQAASAGRRVVYTYVKNSRAPYHLYLTPDTDRAIQNVFERLKGGSPARTR
jgi:hypothetical protein